VMFDSITGFDFKQSAITYLKDLFSSVPYYIFQMLLSTLCMGVAFFIVRKGIKKGFQYSSRLMLMELVFMIYCTTVIYRNTCEVFKYDFHPFWSYEAIQSGRTELLAENIMNVLVFIPIGILIGWGFPKLPLWKAISLGCLISISIETLQFIFKRGFCEVDDVMHNTLGCLIGSGIVQMIELAYYAITKTKYYKY